MADKETIINGVDVSGCEFFFKDNINGTKAQYNAVVEQNKSLQKKCEELKEKKSALENELNAIQHSCTREGCKYFDNGEDFKVFYNCKAKQALDEIEQFVIENCECGEGTFGGILYIIYKAKGLNNENT